jgi:hypothetical protein
VVEQKKVRWSSKSQKKMQDGGAKMKDGRAYFVLKKARWPRKKCKVV